MVSKINFFSIKMCLYICNKINKSSMVFLGNFIICTKDYLLFLFQQTKTLWSVTADYQQQAHIMQVYTLTFKVTKQVIQTSSQ